MTSILLLYKPFIIKIPNTRYMQTNTAVKEDIIEDPLPPENIENLTFDLHVAKKSRYEVLKEKYKAKFQQGEPTKSSINEDGANLHEEKDNIVYTQPFYRGPIITREAFYTDVALKGIVANLDEINERLNVQIKKSEELGQEWNQHISNLDKYIANLRSIPWKNILTYSACIFAILGFLWKMGMLRSIPSFAGNVGLLFEEVKGTATASIKNPENLQHFPKPSAEGSLDTIKGIMESPITRAFS